jgi:hypothetical protein
MILPLDPMPPEQPATSDSGSEDELNIKDNDHLEQGEEVVGEGLEYVFTAQSDDYLTMEQAMECAFHGVVGG